MEFWVLFIIIGAILAVFSGAFYAGNTSKFEIFLLPLWVGILTIVVGVIGSCTFVLSQHSCLGAASNYNVKARYPSTLQGCFWQDPQNKRFITESQWKQIYLNDGKGYTFNIKGNTAP